MATFVLVHGAWHGGWCWKKVAPLLRSAGHEVYTPTLTGLGERDHLLTRDIGLDTHIQDIVNVLEYEELTQVVLVGHSYGGMVVTGVAERAHERLRQLVYLDAATPLGTERSLRALYQRYTPARWAAFEAQIQGPGLSWTYRPRSRQTRRNPAASSSGDTAPHSSRSGSGWCRRQDR